MSTKRSYGTGCLYEKSGAYYGRWRTSDGRQLNRKVGPTRVEGSGDGLTRPQAERAFRKMQDEEERRPRPASLAARVTVGEAADSLRRKLAVEGARKSYLEGCESMQRVHLAPRLGDLPIAKLTTTQVEDLAAAMLKRGRAPKTVRNVVAFLHSVCEHAVERGWINTNPVARATRPKRRRSGDAQPDLQLPKPRRARSGAPGDPRRRGDPRPRPNSPRT